MTRVVSVGSDVTHLEWRLQGSVTALNAAPVFLLAMGVAVFGFFSAIGLGIFGWILFGFLAFLIVLYGIFCVWTATALWQRKEWGLIGSVVIYLLYVLIYYWVESVAAHPDRVLEAPASPQTSAHAVTRFSQLFGASFHLLMLLNIIAFIHIGVRCIRFRSPTTSN